MNNYITYGYRLVDGDMRLDSGQSEAVQLISVSYTHLDVYKRQEYFYTKYNGIR